MPFADCDGGAEHRSIIASLFQTCKLNDVDPLAYLTDAPSVGDCLHLISSLRSSYPAIRLLATVWHFPAELAVCRLPPLFSRLS
ncbi:transposase domain-containing protein [Bradyrhizobium elkanii]|nr:transposase domain-containing protein [Bradyrhizobium elkanii]